MMLNALLVAIDMDRRSNAVGLTLGLVAVLLVVAATGPAVAHTGDDGSHHHDGWMGTHDGMGGWMGGTGFFWALLWPVVLIGVPLVVGYLLLTRRDTGGARADNVRSGDARTNEGTSDDALEVLRRRYARGEIDDEEFDARRRTLRGE
jgi:putative membrane protein